MPDYAPRDLTRYVAGVIRAEMAKQGVSQEEMADVAGVSQSQFSKMIRGVRPITIDQFAAIAEALDIDFAGTFEAAERYLDNYMEPPRSPVRYVLGGVRLQEPEDMREEFENGAPIIPPYESRRRKPVLVSISTDVGGFEEDDFEVTPGGPKSGLALAANKRPKKVDIPHAE